MQSSALESKIPSTNLVVASQRLPYERVEMVCDFVTYTLSVLIIKEKRDKHIVLWDTKYNREVSRYPLNTDDQQCDWILGVGTDLMYGHKVKLPYGGIVDEQFVIEWNKDPIEFKAFTMEKPVANARDCFFNLRQKRYLDFYKTLPNAKNILVNTFEFKASIEAISACNNHLFIRFEGSSTVFHYHLQDNQTLKEVEKIDQLAKDEMFFVLENCLVTYHKNAIKIWKMENNKVTLFAERYVGEQCSIARCHGNQIFIVSDGVAFLWTLPLSNLKTEVVCSELSFSKLMDKKKVDVRKGSSSTVLLLEDLDNKTRVDVCDRKSNNVVAQFDVSPYCEITPVSDFQYLCSKVPRGDGIHLVNAQTKQALKLHLYQDLSSSLITKQKKLMLFSNQRNHVEMFDLKGNRLTNVKLHPCGVDMMQLDDEHIVVSNSQGGLLLLNLKVEGCQLVKKAEYFPQGVAIPKQLIKLIGNYFGAITLSGDVYLYKVDNNAFIEVGHLIPEKIMQKYAAIPGMLAFIVYQTCQRQCFVVSFVDNKLQASPLHLKEDIYAIQSGNSVGELFVEFKNSRHVKLQITEQFYQESLSKAELSQTLLGFGTLFCKDVVRVVTDYACDYYDQVFEKKM